MAFPEGWPPRPPSSMASLRAFREGTSTNNFSDNAYLFIDLPGANPFQPTPYVKPGDNVTPTTSPAGPKGAGNEPREGVNQSTNIGQPKPSIWSMGIIVANRGNKDLLISFDGVNVHGRAIAGAEPLEFYGRHEAGIAIKSATNDEPSDFSIMAW